MSGFSEVGAEGRVVAQKRHARRKAAQIIAAADQHQDTIHTINAINAIRPHYAFSQGVRFTLTSFILPNSNFSGGL